MDDFLSFSFSTFSFVLFLKYKNADEYIIFGMKQWCMIDQFLK